MIAPVARRDRNDRAHVLRSRADRSGGQIRTLVRVCIEHRARSTCVYQGVGHRDGRAPVSERCGDERELTAKMQLHGCPEFRTSGAPRYRAPLSRASCGGRRVPAPCSNRDHHTPVASRPGRVNGSAAAVDASTDGAQDLTVPGFASRFVAGATGRPQESGAAHRAAVARCNVCVPRGITPRMPGELSRAHRSAHSGSRCATRVVHICRCMADLQARAVARSLAGCNPVRTA
jgi:hypothetical protein